MPAAKGMCKRQDWGRNKREGQTERGVKGDSSMWADVSQQYIGLIEPSS